MDTTDIARRYALRKFLEEDPGSRGMSGHVEDDARLTIVRLRAAIDIIRVCVGAPPVADLHAHVAALVRNAGVLLENADRIAQAADANAYAAVLAERERCARILETSDENLMTFEQVIGAIRKGP